MCRLRLRSAGGAVGTARFAAAIALLLLACVGPAPADDAPAAPRPALTRRVAVTADEAAGVRTLADARRLFRSLAGLVIEGDGVSLRQAVVLKPGEKSLKAWLDDIAAAAGGHWVVRGSDGAALVRRGPAPAAPPAAPGGTGAAAPAGAAATPAPRPLAPASELPLTVQTSAGARAAATPTPAPSPAAAVPQGSSEPFVAATPAPAPTATPPPPPAPTPTPTPTPEAAVTLPFLAPEGARQQPPVVATPAPTPTPTQTPEPAPLPDAAPDAEAAPADAPLHVRLAVTFSSEEDARAAASDLGRSGFPRALARPAGDDPAARWEVILPLPAAAAGDEATRTALEADLARAGFVVAHP